MKKSIDYRVSFLRITATLSVILLHTASTISENCDIFNITDSQKIVLSFIHHVLFWAVPVFFMLTGKLLLDSQRDISYEKAIKKYTMRPILALCIFSFPCACIKIFMENGDFNINIIPKAFLALLTNNSFSHFWYLYELIGIYLLLPVLKPFIKTAEKKPIDILLILLFLSCFLFSLIESVTNINIAFDMLLPYSVFYLILGYRLSISVKSVNSLILFTGIVLTSVFILISEIYGFSQYIAGYKSPVIVLLAVCVYLLFDKIVLKNIGSRRFEMIWSIDRLCFGAYLIHPIFIQFTYRFLKIVPTNYNCWWLLIILFFVIFAMLSFMASWILCKIKPLKKYVL